MAIDLVLSADRDAFMPERKKGKKKAQAIFQKLVFNGVCSSETQT